ncbi:hypothetical protein TNIN_21021 [Trichonephila inaurata madagascariensis]|uniref:Uncharacterized protein n=1 Tax=Trichonephila inaurata madagascariensis TaxID=2747483 RepID=A0A8X6Y1J1_9ARAC|nr:hypothetical protein TNIN_21021 [Trichonephila inaurata madagascariensis]
MRRISKRQDWLPKSQRGEEREKGLKDIKTIATCAASYGKPEIEGVGCDGTCNASLFFSGTYLQRDTSQAISCTSHSLISRRKIHLLVCRDEPQWRKNAPASLDR